MLANYASKVKGIDISSDGTALERINGADQVNRLPSLGKRAVSPGDGRLSVSIAYAGQSCQDRPPMNYALLPSKVNAYKLNLAPCAGTVA